MGRGGNNVKAMSQQIGAFLEIIQQLPPNGDLNFKLFIIRGSPQQIEEQLIEEIEGSLCPVGPGPGVPGPAGPMRSFNPGPFNQGHLGLHRMPGGSLLTSTHPRVGAIPTPRVNFLLLTTQAKQLRLPRTPTPDQQSPARLGYAPTRSRRTPSAPAHPLQARPLSPRPPAPGAPPQPQPTVWSDYTKAWEECYKKIGQQPQQPAQPALPAAPPQQDCRKAWDEYY
ncbi:hypothetical protein P7K49_001228 [Saguinus oedipus]|uniref:Uncharacterized protein n=1 Tax=Saguinus oedipus TaxID=9490 RepID=A0ABQ9WHQ3_SAGOE|nr:hypothetical protein P7K49_001228 [Saguinus oedipus]